jgi:tetratricopeptide (TPR) repeat protein
MEGFGLTSLLSALLALQPVPGAAATAVEMEEGFRLLYELRFEPARSRFLSWQATHPADALGYAWLAASYLFEEFYEQGVLTSEFFLDDKRLLGGIRGRPNEQRGSAFRAAARKAEELAQRQLRMDSRNSEAFLALAITTGMRADYTGLIEGRQLESLRLTREAERYAESALSLHPDATDAYVTLGSANYIIGSLPAHKRFFLWFGGIHGDRLRGVMQLQMAAMDGQYLRPFAKVLLALVARRENQPELARRLLEELSAEFPANPLFRHELALLKPR